MDIKKCLYFPILFSHTLVYSKFSSFLTIQLSPQLQNGQISQFLFLDVLSTRVQEHEEQDEWYRRTDRQITREADFQPPYEEIPPP